MHAFAQFFPIAMLAGGLPAGVADEIREQPATILLACVDATGQLLSVNIVKSSGIAEVDEAALKVARASKFSPGKDVDGKTPLDQSCLKFKVKFVLKDGKPELAGS
ncbi:MAG TPA: energy transducer TonB [Steroidobacteraceae bacterium]|nr:energy transducer TonB [Steroidobacteraceae bacterium]